jgi:putative hydrolase of HD superfamily
MKAIFKFLIEIGKLRKIKRKGITFYGVKKPARTSDHTFRMAMMVWLLSQEKKLDLLKALKMALVHDVSKVLTGDITPYDGLLPKDKKEREEFVKRWRRLPMKEKEKRYFEKFHKEYQAIKKLTEKLPEKLKKEILKVWLDYHQGKSKEAKFVFQIDMVENLLEAFEHWKENKNFPTQPWWQHAEEVIDDPALLEFLREIEKEEKK